MRVTAGYLRSTDDHSQLFEALRSRVADRLSRRYEILGVLGRGSAAIVVLARDRRLDRQVAIKFSRPDQFDAISQLRFEREISLLASLQHPNILPLHDCGTVHGLRYYVTPYVEGESLRKRLLRDGQLPAANALRIASDIAEALSHAHGQGVVHRDVKPENVLLSSGRAILADFGIARSHECAEGASITATNSGGPGTLRYMSPEQRFGSERIDGRSDLYSLALVTVEMLLGEVPHWAFMSSVCARLRVRHPIRSVRPDVSREVERSLLKALSADPCCRFASAMDFLASLTGKTDSPLLIGMLTRCIRDRLITVISRPSAERPQRSTS